MKTCPYILAILVAGLTLAAVEAQRDSPPLPPQLKLDGPGQLKQDGYELQPRVPVHEAFLEPTDTAPQSRVLPQPPPTDVREAPPPMRPEGGVVWIGGYRAWDEERGQHVWVSGCWRVPPPGKVWLPGRWQQVQAGWQWIPGAWLTEEQPVMFLPPPPAPQPEQPPALAAGQIFVPGTWLFRQERYVWRPGFALTIPADWVWTNARYITTPAGALFSEGHWDLPVQERGLLFAPVAFPASGQPIDFVPQYAVGADALLGALFVDSRSNHYYFGDYFDERYRQTGLVPWDQYRIRGVGVDPLFGYYRQHGGKGWFERIQTEYTARYKGKGAGGRPFVAAVPLEQIARQGGKLKRVAPDERAFYQKYVSEYSEAARQFARYEKEHAKGGRAAVGPFEPWPKGHPHGMPPGLAKKYQVPTFPFSGFDDDDDKGKGKSKGKGKGKGKNKN